MSKKSELAILTGVFFIIMAASIAADWLGGWAGVGAQAALWVVYMGIGALAGNEPH